MHERLPVYIGDQAVGEFLRYCSQRGWREFLLVADQTIALPILLSPALRPCQCTLWAVVDADTAISAIVLV